MVVDRAWVERNLGFDPIARPAPASTFEFPPAARPTGNPEDVQREIIDFDSESPAGMSFLAFTTATGLSRFTDIPWPKGLAPQTSSTAGGRKGGPLPKADVLVATWTVDEGHALSRVLTPGKDSRNDYLAYTHNYATIAKKMTRGCPAINAKHLGAYWMTTIAEKKVVVFKSESHLSQDTKKLPNWNKGETLPNQDLWKQIIEETQAKLVITTGTAGGIGKQFKVGDVIVSPIVRFDCAKWLKSAPFLNADYQDGLPNARLFSTARTLFKANSGQLPPDNKKRLPKIVRSTGLSSSVLTTDFFGFDTSNNRFHLRGLGNVCEMGDAVLGLVAKDLAREAPAWVAVRNVSDPQIKAVGTPAEQAQMAAQIYKGFGRWSTVCSAIVCWALIAA
jgi:hypothetical protein